MKKRMRAVMYSVVAATLAAVTWWSVTPAYACPLNRNVRVYYDTPDFIEPAVGVGATRCTTGSFQMCWGTQTSFYVPYSEPCDGCNSACY
jgi:hypothetical protein